MPTLIGLIDKEVVDAAFRWLGLDRTPKRNYYWNDTGNADRLANLYEHELIYRTVRKNYYVWTCAAVAVR